MDETLRLLQAIQYVAEHGEVCPANWKPGEKTMIADTDKSLDYFSTLKVSEGRGGVGSGQGVLHGAHNPPPGCTPASLSPSVPSTPPSL